MIRTENIGKQYGSLQVLNGINLEIKFREIVSITGASGAGKSTLLHIMGTLLKPDSGEVFVGGTRISQLTRKGMAKFRNENIGFVFQFHQLLPEFSAIENAIIPALIKGEKNKIATQQAMDLFEYLGILDRANHKPGQLSGGEQQRVAVARALINNPQVIFADEPSGNLDSTHADDLHHLFLKLRNDRQQTFIIVTHNEKLAAISDRVIQLKDGYIV